MVDKLTDVIIGTVDKVGTIDIAELEFATVFRTPSVILEVLATEELDTIKDALDVMFVTLGDKLDVIVEVGK